LVPLALGAFFGASGTAELLGAAFIRRATNARCTHATLVPPRAEPRTADAILARNPLDSVTGPFTGKVLEATAPAPKETLLVQQDPLRAAACEGITTFITTESSDQLWSVATLQGTDEPRPRMRRVGADVAGRHVEYIGYNPAENSPSVWLSRGGTLCQSLLFRSAAMPAAGAPVNTRAPPTSASTSPRSTNVRIVPEQVDGKVIGIRLIGIRPDSLLGTLGLHDGDVVESINGYDLGSPEKALEAYVRLRTAASLTVKLIRRGQPVNIDYRIE
jgi:general secretion pathway protein C